jgi:predicted nucleic acid-binding protein
MIAVDSSVLIDLLGDGPQAGAAEACLRQALNSGPVVVCDIVVSEITAGLGHGAEIMDVVEEMGMRFVPVEQRAAMPNACAPAARPVPHRARFPTSSSARMRCFSAAR